MSAPLAGGRAKGPEAVSSGPLTVGAGAGDDQVKVNLSNAATATFAYDVAIQGGSKTNDITFVGVNAGGSPTFGPAGSVLIDGGGTHNHVDVFGNFPVTVLDARP